MDDELLKIRTLSYLSIASGDSVGSIDVDLEQDEWGIPYIPARRVKGVLKENALEVCEMLGVHPDIMTSVFGNHGKNDGKFYISSFFISGYDTIRKLLLEIREAGPKELRNVLNKRYISQCYSELRYQTALDERGIAQDHSLRVTKAVKPSVEFVGHVNSALLSVTERALIYLAVKNLRRMGLKRNRGFGRVEVGFTSLQFDDFTSEKAIRTLKTFRYSTNTEPIESSPQREAINMTEPISESLQFEPHRLRFAIHLIDPIVLARQQGDQNTIDTERIVPNTTIRGLFASQLIKRLQLQDCVEDDELFRSLFYDHGPQGIYWGAAYRYSPEITEEGSAHEYKTFEPAPLFVRQIKGEELSNHATNIFELSAEDLVENYIPFRRWVRSSADNTGLIQPIDHLYTISGPGTKFYFHSARNRYKGHSVQGDHEIFYYEALEERQQFEGEIVGPKVLLEQLQSLIGKSFPAYIGRSKNAQYGQVEVQLQSVQPMRLLECDDDVIITLVTPGIFYNEAGFPDPSWQNVLRYLQNALGWDAQTCDDNLDIVAASHPIEHYVGVWRTKSPTELALVAGTSFKVGGQCLKNRRTQLERLLVAGFGERTHEGFGRVKFFWSSDSNIDLFKQQSSSNDSKAVAALLQHQNARDLIHGAFRHALKEYIEQEAIECTTTIDVTQNPFSNLHGHMVERLRALFMRAAGMEEFIHLLKYDPQSEKPFYKMLKMTPWADEFNVDKFTSQVAVWCEQSMNKLLGGSLANPIAEIIQSVKDDATFSYALIQRYWLIILGTISRQLSD